MSSIAELRAHPTQEWMNSLRERFPTEPYVERALDLKLRNRNRTSPPSQPVEVLRDKLLRFLGKRIDGPIDLGQLSRLTGGVSKEQYRFTLRYRSDGSEIDDTFVLRLQPQQSSAETHRLREFQLMNALQGVLPVPRGIWIDEDGEELGQPALICSWCEGVAGIAPSGSANHRVTYPPALRASLAEQFIANLAKLARFNWGKRDLSAFVPPQVGSKDGVVTLLNWWRRVWEEDSFHPLPILELAERWLRQNMPVIDNVSVVHGDYRSGNFLFDPTEGRVTAVLDWELAFLGDRHADLAYVVLPHRLETDEDGRVLVNGLCTREHFLAEYERQSGLPVDPARLQYYEVLLRWRAVLIAMGTGARCATAQKSHQDIVLAWQAGRIAPLALEALREVMRNIEWKG